MLSNEQKQDWPELLTIGEASEFLRVHPNTLRNWDKDGTLEAKRIGKKRVRKYLKEDLIKLINKK